MKLSYAYLNEHLEWAPTTASDRRPFPIPAAILATADAMAAEHQAAEDRFRALFVSARRERLAELDALTDQIQPLLDHLDTTWRALETDLGWRHRRAVP